MNPYDGTRFKIKHRRIDEGGRYAYDQVTQVQVPLDFDAHGDMAGVYALSELEVLVAVTEKLTNEPSTGCGRMQSKDNSLLICGRYPDHPGDHFDTHYGVAFKIKPPVGIEPTTSALRVQCSAKLS